MLTVSTPLSVPKDRCLSLQGGGCFEILHGKVCVQGMGRVSRFLFIYLLFFLMKAISIQPALPGLSCGEVVLCLQNDFESLTAIGRTNPALRNTRKTGSFSFPPPFFFFHCFLSCASLKADFVNKAKIPLKSHCLWQ